MIRKIFFIILLMILLILTLLVGGKFPYLLFFIGVLVYVYIYFSLKRIRNNLLGIFRLNTDAVEKGDKIEVSYKVYNSGLLPVPYIEIKDGIPKRLSKDGQNIYIYSMLSFESIELKKEIQCEHRGYYQIGELGVEVGDIFGVINIRFTLKDDIYVAVYPKVYPLDSFSILGREFSGPISTDQKYYEDYFSIKDLRKYQYGDNLKRINWKVTAKKDELFVKNFEISSNTKIQLFMDFQFDKYKDDKEELVEEKIIECALSIIHFALYRNIDIDFVTYTDRKIQLHGKDISRFNEFLELATRIRPIGNINLGEIIINESRILYRGTNIIIITSEIDEKTVSAVLALRERGYVITFIVVKDFTSDKRGSENIELVEKIGIKVYKVDIKDDINHVLR